MLIADIKSRFFARMSPKETGWKRLERVFGPGLLSLAVSIFVPPNVKGLYLQRIHTTERKSIQYLKIV